MAQCFIEVQVQGTQCANINNHDHRACDGIVLLKFADKENLKPQRPKRKELEYIH